MTRMRVSDLYSFGRRREMAKATAPQTRTPATRSNFQYHKIPMMSSGVYFRPGNMTALQSPRERRPQRETHPGTLPVHSRSQESRQAPRHSRMHLEAVVQCRHRLRTMGARHSPGRRVLRRALFDTESSSVGAGVPSQNAADGPKTTCQKGEKLDFKALFGASSH